MSDPTPIERLDFGTVSGERASLFRLRSSKGLTVTVSDYGATVVSCTVPDRRGDFADVVLGFDSVEEYVKSSPYFGCIVGRVANRIDRGVFELEGRRYALATNDPPHHLHGGTRGWDKVIWSARALEGVTNEGASLELTYRSVDGEEQYPGTVTAKVVYTLTADGVLRVEMDAETDRTTLVNLAHHSYWNLGGHDAGSVEDHELQLFADNYTPGAPIPEGRVAKVEGTPFDFRQPKPIGRDLAGAGAKPVGYDHNWVVNGEPSSFRPVGRARHASSGRTLEVWSDQPGVQFYSGNFLDGTARGKGGVPYRQHAGFCLETQKFPNAVNVPEWREQVVLAPGRRYRHVMEHRFGAE